MTDKIFTRRHNMRILDGTAGEFERCIHSNFLQLIRRTSLNENRLSSQCETAYTLLNVNATTIGEYCRVKQILQLICIIRDSENVISLLLLQIFFISFLSHFSLFLLIFLLTSVTVETIQYFQCESTLLLNRFGLILHGCLIVAGSF